MPREVYFVVLRFPCPPPQGHESAAHAFYETEHVLVAEEFKRLFTGDSETVSASGVFGDPGDCAPPVYEVRSAELSVTERVLFRKQVQDMNTFMSSGGTFPFGPEMDARTAFLMRCHIRAGELEPLVREELGIKDEPPTASVQPDSSLVDAFRKLLLASVTNATVAVAVSPLADAFGKLLMAAEKHRLTFLYFGRAQRLKGKNAGWETLDRDDLPQSRIPPKDIDADGEFLFRHRFALDQFAQRAVSTFGPGKGSKPCDSTRNGQRVEIEGSSFPMWSFDELACNYLEKTSDLLLAACKSVVTSDSERRFRRLLSKVAAVAHDAGQPKWYSSMAVRWEYLAQLDEAILAVKSAMAGVNDESEAVAPADSDNAKGPKVAQPNEPETGPDFVRQLSTAIAVAVGVAELDRVKVLYPNSVDLSEIASLRKALSDWLEMKLSEPGFEPVKKAMSDKNIKDLSDSFGMQTVLVLFLPDPAVTCDGEELHRRMEAVVSEGQRNLPQPIGAILARISQIQVFDCRMPHPANDKTYQNPKRLLMILQHYWRLCRQLILDQTDAQIGFKPHPLLPLIVNAKARIEACFDGLASSPKVSEAKEIVVTLIEILLPGELDELSAAPEWTFGEVVKVDTFLAEAQLSLGSASYDLTHAEQAFIKVFEHEATEYRGRVKKTWNNVLNKLDSKREKREQNGAKPTPASQNPHVVQDGPPKVEREILSQELFADPLIWQQREKRWQNEVSLHAPTRADEAKALIDELSIPAGVVDRVAEITDRMDNLNATDDMLIQAVKNNRKTAAAQREALATREAHDTAIMEFLNRRGHYCDPAQEGVDPMTGQWVFPAGLPVEVERRVYEMLDRRDEAVRQVLERHPAQPSEPTGGPPKADTKEEPSINDVQAAPTGELGGTPAKSDPKELSGADHAPEGQIIMNIEDLHARLYEFAEAVSRLKHGATEPLVELGVDDHYGNGANAVGTYLFKAFNAGVFDHPNFAEFKTMKVFLGRLSFPECVTSAVVLWLAGKGYKFPGPAADDIRRVADGLKAEHDKPEISPSPKGGQGEVEAQNESTPKGRGRPMEYTAEHKTLCENYYREWRTFFAAWKHDGEKGSARLAFAKSKKLKRPKSDAMIRYGAPVRKKSRSRKKSRGKSRG